MARKKLPPNFEYVRIDVDYFEHPAIARIGLVAALVNVRAIMYARKHLTDGFIPAALVGGWERDIIDRLGLDAGTAGSVAALVRVGLWGEEPDGFVVADYGDYQET